LVGKRERSHSSTPPRLPAREETESNVADESKPPAGKSDGFTHCFKLGRGTGWGHKKEVSPGHRQRRDKRRASHTLLAGAKRMQLGNVSAHVEVGASSELHLCGLGKKLSGPLSQELGSRKEVPYVKQRLQNSQSHSRAYSSELAGN